MPQPPLTTSGGSPAKRAQSVDSSIAARCPPAEWPETVRRRIPAERRGVPVEPGHRRAHLPDQLVHVDRRDERVVDHGDEDAGRLEGARDEAEVALAERPPVAAVDEDVDRRRPAAGGQEEVERLAGRRA